ncbi:hypothetical protein Tco_1327620 [Tanacetum coccineum]
MVKTLGFLKLRCLVLKTQFLFGSEIGGNMSRMQSVERSGGTSFEPARTSIVHEVRVVTRSGYLDVARLHPDLKLGNGGEENMCGSWLDNWLCTAGCHQRAVPTSTVRS